MKSLINSVVNKLVTNSKKIKFVSIYNVYEYNNISIVVATSPSINPTSKLIDVKYHWFRHNPGKGFVIRTLNMIIRRQILSFFLSFL